MESNTDEMKELVDVQESGNSSASEDEGHNCSTDIVQQWLRELDIAAIRRGAPNSHNHRHPRIKKSSSTITLHPGNTDESHLVDDRNMAGRASRPASRLEAIVNDRDWIKMVQEQASFSSLVAQQAIEQVRVGCSDRGHLLSNLWKRTEHANNECVRRLQRALDANATSIRSLEKCQQTIAELTRRLSNTEAERDAIRIQSEECQQLFENERRQREIANATLDDVRRRYKTEQAAFLDRLVTAERERDELKASYGHTLVMYEDEHALLEKVIGKPLHEHVRSGTPTCILLLWDLTESFSTNSAFAGLKIARRTNMIVMHGYRGTYRAMFLEFNSIEEAKSSRVVLSSWARCDFATDYPGSEILITGITDSDDDWLILERQISLLIGDIRCRRCTYGQEEQGLLLDMGTPELATAVLATYHCIQTGGKQTRLHVSYVTNKSVLGGVGVRPSPSSVLLEPLSSSSSSSSFILQSTNKSPSNSRSKNQAKATTKQGTTSSTSALDAANTLIVTLQERLDSVENELKKITDEFGIYKIESQQRIKDKTEDLDRANSAITNLRQSMQKLLLQLDMKEVLIQENLRTANKAEISIGKKAATLSTKSSTKIEDHRLSSSNIELGQEPNQRLTASIGHINQQSSVTDIKPAAEGSHPSTSERHSHFERTQKSNLGQDRSQEHFQKSLSAKNTQELAETPQDVSNFNRINQIIGNQTMEAFPELDSPSIDTNSQESVTQDKMETRISPKNKKKKPKLKRKPSIANKRPETDHRRTAEEIPDLKDELSSVMEFEGDEDIQVDSVERRQESNDLVDAADVSACSPVHVEPHQESELQQPSFEVHQQAQSVIDHSPSPIIRIESKFTSEFSTDFTSEPFNDTSKSTRPSEVRSRTDLNKIGIRSDDDSGSDSDDRGLRRMIEKPSNVKMRNKPRSSNTQAKTKSKKIRYCKIDENNEVADYAPNCEPTMMDEVFSEVELSEGKTQRNEHRQRRSLPQQERFVPPKQDAAKQASQQRMSTKSAKSRHEWVQKMLNEENERISNISNHPFSRAHSTVYPNTTISAEDIKGEWSGGSSSHSEQSLSEHDHRQDDLESSDKELFEQESMTMKSTLSNHSKVSQASTTPKQGRLQNDDAQLPSTNVATHTESSVSLRHRKKDTTVDSLSELDETPLEDCKTYAEDCPSIAIKCNAESDTDSGSEVDYKRKPRRQRATLPPGRPYKQISSTRIFHKRSLLRRIHHIYQCKLDNDARRKRCSLPLLSLNEFILEEYIPVNFGLDTLVQLTCHDLYTAVLRFSRHLPEVALFKMFYDNAFSNDTVSLVTLYMRHRQSALSSQIWNVTTPDMLDLCRLGESHYICQDQLMLALNGFFPTFSHCNSILFEQELQALATSENRVGMHTFLQFCIQKQYYLNLKFQNTAHRIFTEMGFRRKSDSNMFWYRPMLTKILSIMFRSATIKQVEQAVIEALSDPISVPKFIAALEPLAKCFPDPILPEIYQSVSAPITTISPQCLSLSKLISDHWTWFKSSSGFGRIRTVFQRYTLSCPISIQVAGLQDYADLLDSLIEANFSIEALLTYKKMLLQIHLIGDIISYYQHHQQPSFDAVGRELSQFECSVQDRFQNEQWYRDSSGEGQRSGMECARTPNNPRSCVEIDQSGGSADSIIVKLQKSISNKSIRLKPQTFDGVGMVLEDSNPYHCRHACLQPNPSEYRSKQLYTNGIRLFNMAAYHELRRSMSTDHIKPDRIKLTPIPGSKQK